MDELIQHLAKQDMSKWSKEDLNKYLEQYQHLMQDPNH